MSRGFENDKLAFITSRRDPEAFRWDKILWYTRTERLYLHLLAMESRTSRILSSLLYFPELQTLIFDTCFFQTPDSTVHMIRSCPQVVSFHLRDTIWKKQDLMISKGTSSSGPRPPLTYLRSSSNLEPSLQKSQFLTSPLIRSLSFEITVQMTWSSLSKIAAKSGRLHWIL